MICHPHVKINLGLSVLRRREDGFHDLETLFLPYAGISDTLEIITGDDWSGTSASLFSRYSEGQLAQEISGDGSLMITIARAEGVGWDPLSDLTARAYFLLKEDYTLPPMKIFLEKTSPVGAGLGGGSSDAACALRMIASLAALDLSDEVLASYASRLGSDCAFFVYDRPMIGEGRGEVLTEYDIDLSAYRIEVHIPEGVAVSTAEAYRGITPRDRSEEAGMPLREALARPAAEWKDCLTNDFEKTVFAVHPEIEALKQSMYDRGAVYSSMSGSGSSVFAFFEK